jgi:hypothetical protein
MIQNQTKISSKFQILQMITFSFVALNLFLERILILISRSPIQFI